MNKLEFKTQDFSNDTFDRRLTDDQARHLAQAIYDKHLEGLPKVYGVQFQNKENILFNTFNSESTTHTARLDAMEKLE